MPAVSLPSAIAGAIARHALAERPNEACGVIVGSAPAADGGTARRYVACRNAAASPSRYLVHPDDLLAVLADLDRAGGELWGVVHSHPLTPAVPSAADIAEATWPSAVHVLVSPADAGGPPVIRAWRIAGGQAFELALTVEAAGDAPGANAGGACRDTPDGGAGAEARARLRGAP